MPPGKAGRQRGQLRCHAGADLHWRADLQYAGAGGADEGSQSGDTGDAGVIKRGYKTGFIRVIVLYCVYLIDLRRPSQASPNLHSHFVEFQFICFTCHFTVFYFNNSIC